MLWSPNLQLHYPFENQANDYSGNARHGTVNGSGVYATRPGAGRCLYFDGVGDFVATPSFGLSGTVVVFAAWVRNGFNALIEQAFLGDGAYSTTVGFITCARGPSQNYVYWRYANGTAVDAAFGLDFFTSPYDNVWVHLMVACDYAGKKVYFYRNGTPFGTPSSMSGTPVFPSTDRAKYLGGFNNTGTYPLTGYLQNVQLWTLATMPAVSQMTANANRLTLGMHPIW